VFFTRIPVGTTQYRDTDWRWAAAHLPAVGIVVGGASAGTYATARGLGAHVAANLAVVVSIGLTGAMHEDGLADSADALGGAMDRQHLLDILRDSRIGTYGAVALVGSLLSRVLLIAQLDSAWSLVLMAAAARLWPVWLMASLPYVSPSRGKGHAVVRAGYVQAVVATAWALAAALALAHSGVVDMGSSGAALASAAGLTLLAGRWFRARAGGITGDFLGATEQACEVTILLVLLAIGRLNG
jgi:adenosylcobinamide-GDP ribazoletransferase